MFFLELLSAVEPRVVNWSLVTNGETGKNYDVTTSLLGPYSPVLSHIFDCLYRFCLFVIGT